MVVWASTHTKCTHNSIFCMVVHTGAGVCVASSTSSNSNRNTNTERNPDPVISDSSASGTSASDTVRGGRSESSGSDVFIVGAFDINQVANDVYSHNFFSRPCAVCY